MRWLAFPKMTLSLVLSVVAALFLTGISEFGYRQSSRALADIGQAHQVRLLLGNVIQDVLNAETGQRGFLLTGETRYRAPYDTAVSEIDGHLVALRKLYKDRAAESGKLAVLTGHTQRKLAEMEMSMRLRQEGKDDAWRFVMTTDVGREEMEAIRVQAAELIALSDASLKAGQTQVSRSLALGRLGVTFVALVALLAFVLYLRQTHLLRSAGERQQEALQKERNALEDEVRERTATLTELATHLQNVQETERGYLARELHDELGSLLTAAKLDVARLKSRLADSPDAIERLRHLTDLLNSGIALKRRIIEDLRPSSLSNLGLVASLEILGREFADRSGLQVEMALEPVDTDEARQLTIYRMVQEGLTNISKYADATEATIVLKNYENHLVVEVSDNGKGFEADRARPSTHGLAGMRHRVEAAQGKLKVSSTPGQGTTLSAMLPTRAH